MVPQPITTSDEKEQIRLSSLELRITEFENSFLRTANASLEKRVVELENSLKESTQECVKLREMIAIRMENDSFNSSKKYEFESAYGRIVKLVEEMKSEGVKAINLKISSVSNLPKFPAKVSNSRPGTPKNQNSITSSPARSRASSVSNISIPSRSNTPSGIKIPSSAANAANAINVTSAVSSLKVPNLSPPNSHTSSRPTTPSSTRSTNIINPIQNNSVNSVSKMPLRSRTPIWPSCTNSSRPSTPNNSNTSSNTLNTQNIPNISITQSPLCNDIASNILDVDPSIHSNISSVLASKSTGIPMYAQMTRKQAIV
ncbi:22316_t:CDS:2 [Cetraspora pellucida]|uniref:22316_t:CDS:1 n=1 Tax=Cetraspora pellucida TaxID=1433469 RepID=A0A9N9G3T9_9GLOM|nr:22316_t:CDS:2 [Cetraspora pellucida]